MKIRMKMTNKRGSIGFTVLIKVTSCAIILVYQLKITWVKLISVSRFFVVVFIAIMGFK